MTNKEIEALRLRLQRVAALAVNADEAKAAFDDIDALCEAVLQPKSLVGRRVRVKARFDNECSFFGRITSRSFLGEFTIVPDGCEVVRSRDDFELLEDTDA